MEDDDDEFGDLYADVIGPSASSSASQPPPLQSTEPSLSRPTQLNIQSDDEEILYGGPNSSPSFNVTSSNQNQNQTLVSEPEKAAPELILSGSSDSRRNLNIDEKLESQEVDKKEDLAGVRNNWASNSSEPSKDLGSVGEMKLQKRGFEVPNFLDESSIDVVVDERDDKDDVVVGKNDVLMGRGENFGIFDTEEVDTGIRDLGSQPIIPGLSIPGVSDAVNFQGGGNFGTRNEASAEGDDWDSDSEDDLQIVLNDNNHGPTTMDRAGLVGSDDDDEDEDGDPLIIVADTDPNHQPMEEQEWSDDVAQGADGERKDLGDAAKVNGGLVAPPKIAYNNHGYHPFHSQFKYVRPGAASMPGAAPTVPGWNPGQVRPTVNMAIAGCGRGDWRPTGMKNASPMQKSFHPGFGMPVPVWGNNASGRAFGSGLDFTLPSYKTIFDVEVDSFEEKPWRLLGVDISDFFNFSLNEESWKDYCKQLEQLRLEATMQSRIRVYEGGRTEQEYDPDLPPELAAAAGIREVSSENGNTVKTDAGQSDFAKSSTRVRPPLPTGRAIQVESGYGERLPSIDTRPPRFRDSDAIIEIVLQDSTDDDSFPGNDVVEQPENDPSSEDLRGGHEIEEDIAQDETEHFDGIQHAYKGRKRELVGRDNTSEGDGILPFPPEAPSQYHPVSQGQTRLYPGRNFGTPYESQAKGRAHDRSPNMTPSEGTQDKRFFDDLKEELVESIGGEHSPLLSSPVSAGGIAVEPVVELGDDMHDELVLADGSSGMEREEMALNNTTSNLEDEIIMHSVKKQKLSSRVEQSSLQEIDDGEDLKAARSSENSKARSGSSRDHQKLRDGIQEEVVQDGHSTCMENIKRPLGEDKQFIHRKGHDERQETERHRMVVKGREGSYSHRDRDSTLAHHLHMKTLSIDRRKERDNSDGAWQLRDADPHGRKTRGEETRKWERGDEMGFGNRSNFRESERSDTDEHLQLRKQLDSGSWRGHCDKDVGSRHRERDENLKSHCENMDDLHSKRRKEEEHLRRDHTEKEAILHGHRENATSRKQERDDAFSQRKRDDQVRLRDDDCPSVRHKEEIWLPKERGERQREQEEWYRPKQSHEESLSKQEREERRGGIRSGRVAEDKVWVSHARVKDEHKGSDRNYQFKDTGRHNEQLKRRDRVEDGSLSRHRGREDAYARGNQLGNEERKSRQERANSRNDLAVTSDKHREHEKKHKENTRKRRESEGGGHNSSGLSKRNRDDHGGQMNDTVILKGKSEHGIAEPEIPVNHSSRKHREDASSDDEHQDSRRGRSKLERWTSHKDSDFSIRTNSSSSLKVKEIGRYNNDGSSLISKLPDESFKMESVDNQHPLGDEKDAGNPVIKNVDVKSMEDTQFDTVAKLKRRSERFKLPMPSEKEAMAIKKMEGEPLPSDQSETRADSEIKQERPARKRRWISN